MHPCLLLWLTSQPEEIQAVIHSLGKSNSITLVWDSWAEQPLAVLSDRTAKTVVDALGIEDLAVAVRVKVRAG